MGTYTSGGVSGNTVTSADYETSMPADPPALMSAATAISQEDQRSHFAGLPAPLAGLMAATSPALRAAAARPTTRANTISLFVEPRRGMPTFAQTEKCFLDARNYYKGGEKSFNKLYLPLDGTSSKSNHRYINASTSYTSMREVRRMNYHRTPVQKGHTLFVGQSKYGACHEMSNVAAFLINCRFPDADIYTIDIGSSTHRLLVVGQQPSRESIEHWHHQILSDSYAVDVWAGICCPVNEYPEKIAIKLDKWGKSGKVIVEPGEPWTVFFPVGEKNFDSYAYSRPNSDSYVNAILHQPLEIGSAK
ncbi:hypothetical protein GWC77_23485 [Paraburkholderia sp. NMBU_R16]|uniref:hypothetical protein n=1 Tax=Paraburkholderia sp. NMBU_R16 TaxID=2698676 RepID=UPI0015664A68|nr:hypothetical protein [Paraburkholderia sp. NMBU_R16]NRO98876.1 hypothetical protein [Paraburkholderia sp. NMBU_R16]